jgi:hypothetical protein
MNEMHIQRPSHISPYAVACLEALAAQGLGDAIVLGGALGLLHYLDYRTTADADAWWTEAATPERQREVVDVLTATLAQHGQVRMRAWGDVTSVELQEDGRTVFSFQIARRSAQLAPAQPISWTGVLLDSFADLVGSKMVALVERGAPRDFRDIYAVCQAQLATPQECWALWRERQHLAGSDADKERATLAIQTHLARIERHRPLAQIEDSQQHSTAEAVRMWIREVFLREQCPDS